MPILQLEHPISDYALWKQAFDRDPVGRGRRGVRAHRVAHPVGEPAYVVVDLEFETLGEAEAFEEALNELWRSRDRAPALAGTPRVRILEVLEARAY